MKAQCASVSFPLEPLINFRNFENELTKRQLGMWEDASFDALPPYLQIQ